MDYYNGNMRGTDGMSSNYPDMNYGAATPNDGMSGADMTGPVPTPYAAYPDMAMGDYGINSMPQSGMQPQAGMNYMDPTMSPKAQTQSGMGYMDPPMSPQMQPQSDMGYMDPPTSPEMQQFMEQGYLMGPNCFGSDSQRYANLLMEYINDEYRDYMYYTTLSRRAPTASGRRVFRNISGDEMKHARRWASAYFLITGKRYFPTRTTVEPVNVPSNYSQALRERYMAESRDAVKYRQFAASTTDRCLKRMATDTSDDERQHAQDILTLIQNM